jgi:hypothetical protein
MLGTFAFIDHIFGEMRYSSFEGKCDESGATEKDE